MFAIFFYWQVLPKVIYLKKLSSSDGPSVLNSSARTQTHVIDSAYIAAYIVKTQLYK